MLSTSTLLKTSLVLLGILSTALAAEARNRHSSHAVSVGGEVEVVKEIPGGVVRVGVVIGKGGHRVEHREPEVIVVKERPREPEVVVIEKSRPRHRKTRHQEVIVVQEPACDRDWRDAGYRRSREREFRHMGGKGGHGNIRVYESGNQFSYHRQGHGYNERYFRDGHQVSYTVEGPEGRYHYFENGEMISIDDNRQGANQHVFIRK
jgi:hypothetical protein